MEEFESEHRDKFPVREHFHEPGVGELPDNCRLHVPQARKLEKRIDALWRDGEAHALLGLADKDFPRGEALVLQQALVEVDGDAAAEAGHLAQRRGKPPAPLSVMPRYSPLSRASSSMSSIFFCVIGSPICTADVGEVSLSASEENVAP